jgi:antirestriction protein ArdC
MGTQHDRTAVLFATFESGLQGLFETESWQRYLAIQARFPRYSSFNALLIHLQRPGAIQVAGYQAWRRLGRQVRRGEHGIQILAPRFQKRVRSKDAKGQDVVEVVEHTWFQPVTVFDVSQTDGPDGDMVTGEAFVQELTGLDGEDLFTALAAFAGAEGCRVEVGPIEGHARGWYDRRTHVIRVQSDMAPTQMAKTLAHELGHALLHGETDMSRPDRELEAESVAYVVLAHFGVDAGAYSFGYVGTWQQAYGLDALKQLRASAQRIQKAASRIITAVENCTNGQENATRTLG